ncbi:hypothetical protein YC2023_041267 [Brassica napus]
MEDPKALHLAEFAYIDNYRSSIEMTPYEAIYGRPCRIPLCWTKDWLWDAHDGRGFMQLSVIGSANSQLNQCFTVDTEGTRDGRDIIGKILIPPFQIIYPIVKSTYICVYHQPGDEATLVKQMVSDWSKLALPEYHIDLISESSGVALLEPSRSIRCFLRFLQNSWQRGSETSGLAILLVRACGAETFVPWTLLERAWVQRQTVLATLRIIYPYEEMRGHPIPLGVTPLLLTPPIPSPFR